MAGDTDRANNRVGFGIKGDCVEGCLNALRNGQLQCYAEGDMEPWPCRVPPQGVPTR